MNRRKFKVTTQPYDGRERTKEEIDKEVQNLMPPNRQIVRPQPRKPDAPPPYVAPTYQEHVRMMGGKASGAMDISKVNPEAAPATPAPRLASAKTEQVAEPVRESNNVPLRVNRQLDKNLPFAERTLLPSNGVFYDKDIQIRRFKVAEVASLYQAVRTQDDVLMHDMINNTIDFDVRDLWMEDLKSLMYWHRFNSFVKMPWTVPWTSMYGNQNTTEIHKTAVRTTPLKVSPEEYRMWFDKGFCVPTVRDREEYLSLQEKLSPEDEWSFYRAQYIQGDSVKDKIERFNDMDTDVLSELKEFHKLFAGAGIVERAQVKDAFFEHETAINFLEARDEELKALILDPNLPTAAETVFKERYKENSNELARLKSINIGEAEPMLETIRLNPSLFSFFSDI